ncbi:MAG: hypothetical protein GY931_15755 [Maribacter sp.]|nr:hypothetical protein [Maribacter sp.]
MKPVDYNHFLKNLSRENPPREWPLALKALWFDAKGNWDFSHDIVQELHSDLGSWIHAYLHRKEGDEFNAGYWYGKAHKPFPKISIKEELKELVEYILSSTDF